MLYEFLEALQIKEIVRLSERNINLLKGIALDSEDRLHQEKFPAFPGSEPKQNGRKFRGQVIPFSKEYFVANSLLDLKEL